MSHDRDAHRCGHANAQRHSAAHPYVATDRDAYSGRFALTNLSGRMQLDA